MGSAPLPLSIICDVTVVTSAPAVAAPAFNTGLIIGPSNILPAGTRTQKFLAATFTQGMSGFTNTPEFAAMQLYFSQSPQPQQVILGSQLSGETGLQAFQACRIASGEWYAGMVVNAADADHIAIAAWVDSQLGTVYFGTTQSTGALNGTPNNVLQTIYNTTSRRTWMQYASTQSGAAPNQAYFTAAVMGQAMASNTQLANSSFTEKFSGGVQLIGVMTEPGMTITQIANIEGSVPGQGPNGNLYLNYANAYNILEQGTMMGEYIFFDQVLGLDVLAAAIQYAVLNVLTTVPKIPQNDAGQQIIIQAVEQALQQSAITGFIGPGIWQGQNILGQITPGTAMPAGYAVCSPAYKTIPPSMIQARQAPPIYCAIIEAGAVHFTTIGVLVQV